jgi:hypothetical protein
MLFVIIATAIILALTLPRSGNNDNKSNSQDTIAPGLVGKFLYESGEGVTTEYKNDIIEALKTWDNIIKDDHEISVSFYSYSSNDSTLAFAFMNDEDDIYSGGVVYINTFNRAQTSMKNIIEHEIGHVLGIGTSRKWDTANNSDILDKKLFPEAYKFYDSLSESPNKNGIPLGSNGYHWSEKIFDIEMMTPYSEKKGVELPISGLTLNALKDIGWNVDMEKADSFSLT